MKLIVLGADGSWTSPGGAASGYLVSQDGFNLWLDAGNGTLARVQEYSGIADLGAIAITHSHPDHYVDLYLLLVAMHYGRVGKPDLPVFVPEGFPPLFAAPMSDDTSEAMRETFYMHEVKAGEFFDAGPFDVEVFAMAHFGNSLGFRVSSGGSVLAYTGDTGPTDEVVKLARDADLLVSEATWQDADDPLPFHFTARSAAEHASRAGAKKLMLTHLTPLLDPDASRAQASEEFEGEILVARRGMEVTV